MNYVEVEGSSIDEAIERALAQLGVEREKVEIEILSNAARGLFGLGGRKAKVRATIRSALRLSEEAPAKPATSMHDGASSEATELEPTAVAGSGSAATAGSADGAALTELREVLQGIVRRMGIEARVEAVSDGRLVIRGDSSGILIGRRGQTLDAIEYVINRIAARDEDSAGRVVVDTEGYRERRRHALETMARRLGERARRRGKPVTLSPMSPRDRRIVHLALQGDTAVTTRSTGDGYFRRLVIVPSSSRGNRRGSDRRGAVRAPGQGEEA